MQPIRLDARLSVSPQISVADVAEAARLGFRAIVCNRPDGEAADQVTHAEIGAAARSAGLAFVHAPVESGRMSDGDVADFAAALAELPGPVLAYCRTGTRSASLWALSQGAHMPIPAILAASKAAGFDLSALASRIGRAGRIAHDLQPSHHEILIIGGGAAGAATAASLLAREPSLDVTVIDPADVHYYQPGWTLVGAGVFSPQTTARTMTSVLPDKVKWIKAAVVAFEPERNTVVLEGCRVITYGTLVVCPGLKLDWDGIEGLADTLGRNGVTSNYRYDLAPYTWELTRMFKGGQALFTQPPMPIKCAGAPQKAMYLACDHWLRNGVLGASKVGFHSAGAVLFGVADYVPALMEYVRKYAIDLNFGATLVRVDGPAQRAWFRRTGGDGQPEIVERSFDFLHAVPPQTAPDFIRASPLADAAGWVDVDPATLRHRRFANIHALGDVVNTSNAKTAAAARKQAPVVAENVLHQLGRRPTLSHYDGYGSCPLTVERGRIVLAEFSYGGKLAPSFPRWFIDGRRPSRLAWYLKERILPPIYWHAMLKGREWLARPLPAATEQA